MLALIVLVVLPYLGFVFFGESFDPIHKPTMHSHRATWKYGRLMALAIFIGSAAGLSVNRFGDQSLQKAILFGMSVSILMGTIFSVKKLTKLLKL